jgi:hypothetical protein
MHDANYHRTLCSDLSLNHGIKNYWLQIHLFRWTKPSWVSKLLHYTQQLRKKILLAIFRTFSRIQLMHDKLYLWAKWRKIPLHPRNSLLSFTVSTISFMIKWIVYSLCIYAGFFVWIKTISSHSCINIGAWLRQMNQCIVHVLKAFFILLVVNFFLCIRDAVQQLDNTCFKTGTSKKVFAVYKKIKIDLQMVSARKFQRSPLLYIVL